MNRKGSMATATTTTGGGSKKSTKKLDKKDKFAFDFSGPWVSEDLFAVPATNKRGGISFVY